MTKPKGPRSAMPRSLRGGQPKRITVDASKDEGAAALKSLATHPASQAEHHVQAALRNETTGRHFLISFPRDFSDEELFSVVGWLSTNFRKQLAALRAQDQSKPPVPPVDPNATPQVDAAKPKLVVARSMPQQPVDLDEVKRRAKGG